LTKPKKQLSPQPGRPIAVREYSFIPEPVRAYALAEFKRQYKAKVEVEGVRSHLGILQQEREKLKVEISNLAAVIAQGRQSPALLAELEKRERRLTEIGDEIFSSSGNGLDAKLKEIEDFVMRRLGDNHGLLTSDVQRAQSELAKHCAEILAQAHRLEELS
jgi:prefoldin subunit 5